MPGALEKARLRAAGEASRGRVLEEMIDDLLWTRVRDLIDKGVAKILDRATREVADRLLQDQYQTAAGWAREWRRVSGQKWTTKRAQRYLDWLGVPEYQERKGSPLNPKAPVYFYGDIQRRRRAALGEPPAGHRPPPMESA